MAIDDAAKTLKTLVEEAKAQLSCLNDIGGVEVETSEVKELRYALSVSGNILDALISNQSDALMIAKNHILGATCRCCRIEGNYYLRLFKEFDEKWNPAKTSECHQQWMDWCATMKQLEKSIKDADRAPDDQCSKHIEDIKNKLMHAKEIIDRLEFYGKRLFETQIKQKETSKWKKISVVAGVLAAIAAVVGLFLQREDNHSSPPKQPAMDMTTPPVMQSPHETKSTK